MTYMKNLRIYLFKSRIKKLTQHINKNNQMKKQINLHLNYKAY